MAKISIKVASKGNTQFDLSQNHITTTDFGQIQVSHFLPVIPNDKIHCNLASEARFAPMVVPTFMDVNLVTRAFYVPMSAIYQPFEYFYTDRQDSSVFKTLPSITNADFIAFLTSSSYDYMRQVDGTVMPFDVKLGNDYYLFTERGRLAMKLFNSLGYSFNWNSSDTTSMSLLPILSFMRVCYDYVYPSQYIDGLGITKYFKISSSSDYSACFGTTALINSFLASCISLLHLPYKQDYFTAAWRNLNAPGTSVQSISATSPDGQQTITTSQGTVQTAPVSSGNLSQYALNLMQRMYDFVTRNNIVGVRYADQLFARFGIGSRKSDPDMSQFIGQHIQPINVVDVTAMSSAQGQDLGDLAGKAYLQGRGSLYNFDSVDEFGYILSLSFLMPQQGYYQGRKRWTTQFGRFDFYHPEFDMQMRAIRNDEVFADYKDSDYYTQGQSYGGNPSVKFGHAPNYSEFKKGDDFVTGDFRIDSLKRNLDSYYLMRDIVEPSYNHPLSLNSEFLFMQQHEYDKIFAQVYALRAPLTWLDVNLLFGKSLLLYDHKPVVFLIDSSDTSKGCFIFYENYDGKIKITFFSKSNILTAHDIDLDDTSTYYPCPMTVDSSINLYSLAGVSFMLSDMTTSPATWVNSTTQGNYSHRYGILYGSSLSNAKRLIFVSEFMSYFQDYIDHVYLKHRFDIKATRSMLPISQEFMIQDGGNLVNVDMNGNRIS